MIAYLFHSADKVMQLPKAGTFENHCNGDKVLALKQ